MEDNDKKPKSVSFALPDASPEQKTKPIPYAVHERLKVLEQEKKQRRAVRDIQQSLLKVEGYGNSCKSVSVSLEHLYSCCTILRPQEYDDVVTERSYGGVCGYPICGTILDTSGTKAKFKLSFKRKELLDVEDYGRYCSTKCWERSTSLKSKLPLSSKKKSKLLAEKVTQAPVIEAIKPAASDFALPRAGDAEAAAKVEGFLSSSKFSESKINIPDSYLNAGKPRTTKTLKRPGILKIKQKKQVSTKTSVKEKANSQDPGSLNQTSVDGNEKSSQEKTTAVKPSVSEDVSDFMKFGWFDVSNIEEDISSIEFTSFMRIWDALNQFLHSKIDDRYSVPMLGDVESDTFQSRRHILRGHLNRGLDLLRENTQQLDADFTKAHLVIMLNSLADSFDVSRQILSMSSYEWMVVVGLAIHTYIDSSDSIVGKATYLNEIKQAACSTIGRTKTSQLAANEYDILLSETKPKKSPN